MRQPWLAALLLTLGGTRLVAQTPVDTVAIHLNDVDLRSAIQVLSQYLDRPVVIAAVPGAKITLETPKAVRRSEVVSLLRATLESQNLELVSDSAGPYRIRPKEAPRPAIPDPSTVRRAAGPVDLFVIRLRHAAAQDVAAIVNALYGKASAFGEMSAPTATLSQQLQQLSNSTFAPPPGAGTSAVAVRGASLAGETTIIPDRRTNSLLVRATQSDYQLIAGAVKQLDVRPLQALIEVMIVEVRRDRSLSFGIDVSLPTARLPGHPNTTYDGVQQGSSATATALRVVGIGGDPDFEATIRAAASRGNVTILSRPSVVAANNEKAEILVGSQRPFVQVQRSLPTQTPTRDQVVQYKDVGTKLSVRPTISDDGYVMLEVSQEVNAATAETQFNAPVISTRSVQTRLLLKNGQTAVIGGLTDRQHGVTQTGVPVLSSIPWIGGLFGHAERTSTETELFLFITPRVITDDASAAALAKPAQERADKVQ